MSLTGRKDHHSRGQRDQQASIFLQQKLKVADSNERSKIMDAIRARGFEMLAHRFGNWAVQRCLEAASTAEERRSGRIVILATNCYALDCEEDIRLAFVSELLLGDPAQTLVNRHASHVRSKIIELSWTPPAPPIFSFVNKSLKGKWAVLACHEAGSYCIQHKHGADKHRQLTLDHLISEGYKSVTKALKEGGKDTLDKVVKRMCEPAKSARRAIIVDLAVSVTGNQLIASVLPTADKDQRALLYDCIRGHIVTLHGCKTGSKGIWLL
ncbi:armadillo-type protein [Armillaria fumosa]|nr:armadillo-type protein [Armillaria fumosa]